MLFTRTDEDEFSIRNVVTVRNPGTVTRSSINISGDPLARYDVITFNSRPIISTGLTNASVAIETPNEILLADPNRIRADQNSDYSEVAPITPANRFAEMPPRLYTFENVTGITATATPSSCLL